MKNAEMISASISSFEGLKGLKSYLGKKVFSKSGAYVGRISDVYTKNNSMRGILVKSRVKIFFDKDYIHTDSPDAIMLSIDPVTHIIGRVVFDSEGRKLGKVIGLERKDNSNSYSSIVVKKRLISKPFVVSKGEIETCKKNCILKSAYDNKR